MTCAPSIERPSFYVPNHSSLRSSTHITPAVPAHYTPASASRPAAPKPPLASTYRVVNTGYSPISPSNTRASSRA
jgi:hypothetical protein